MPGLAQDAWAPGPARPLLTECTVHVWRADLSALAAEALEDLLSDEERARAERFVNADDAKLWRRSHGLLRALIGRYLQHDPKSLQFVIGEHGKPALAGSSAHDLTFNMSHSGELALYAFSSSGEVGVDVEVARRSIDEVEIARRMLGASEATRLQALDPETRRREFLRGWTRHEAEVKCLGLGIGAERNGHGEGTEEPRPWVGQLELGTDAAAAVACKHPARELRCWDWQAS
jgi:4'-phosphopantetheinyl transferase